MSTMTVKLLIAQRAESYPGEYGPEVLAAVDEFTDDSNPDYFVDACAKELDAVGDDIEAHAVFNVTLPLDTIYATLRPTAKMPAAGLTSLGDPQAAGQAYEVLRSAANSDPDSPIGQEAAKVLDRLGAARTHDGQYL